MPCSTCPRPKCVAGRSTAQVRRPRGRGDSCRLSGASQTPCAPWQCEADRQYAYCSLTSNPGSGNAAKWQQGNTPRHAPQSGFMLSIAAQKYRILSKTFAIKSVGLLGDDYNVTYDTERQLASRGGGWRGLCRPERGQVPGKGSGPGHSAGPQEPPYLPAAALPGGAGSAFAGGNCLAHPQRIAPGTEYRSSSWRSHWF